MAVKKHVKKQPFREQISINATNSVVIVNSDNSTLEVPLPIYEIFKSKVLDTDLNKIVSPLVQDRINAAELEARSPDGTSFTERVEASERPYFDVTETSVTSTSETWLVASINSLTKSTKSGYLYLTDGTRVFYRYAGDNEEKLFNLFSYSGPVRVKCIAHMDENLKPTFAEVLDIEKIQGELFPKVEPLSRDEGKRESTVVCASPEGV